MGLESLNIENLHDSSIKFESSAESLSDLASGVENSKTESIECLSIPESLENISSTEAEQLERIFFSIESTELLNDRETVEKIAEYLESVEGIKYENWVTLSLEERTELLRTIEAEIAEIEHRTPMAVGIEELPKGYFGYQCADNNSIAINSLYVMDDSPEAHREVLDTIIHEGRHAYQHYNVDVRQVHESGAEVETWRENYYDKNWGYYSETGQHIYIPTSDGWGFTTMPDYRLYYYQPVEIDARNFAKDVMSELDGRGVLG